MGYSSAAHPGGTALGGAVNLSQESGAFYALRAAAGNIAWEEHYESLWSNQNGSMRMIVRASSVRTEGRHWDWLGYAMLLLVSWLVIAGYPTELSWGAEWLSNALLFGVGMILAVRGRPIRHASKTVVLDVDVENQRLWIRQHPDDVPMEGEPGLEVWRAAEVLFARRRITLPDVGIQTDMAGVFLRLDDGTVWPVASGVRDHSTAFTTARAIARFLRVPLKQVGWGWGGAAAV
jgi:hypothetical protein